MKSFLNNSASRGLRNNNPGNLVRTSIKWQGKIPLSQNPDERFEQFTHIEWGIRAFYMDIINDIKKGLTTIEKLVNEYAPPFENNTVAYVNMVAQIMGISKDTPLTINAETLIALAKAKFTVELGAQYQKLIPASSYEDAWDLLPKEYASLRQKPRQKFCENCGHVIVGIFLVILTVWAFKI